ncbi:hypothetical protein [Arcobacter sp. L]|uniref:hypothetical protein n=1 Tax=Arcobacter sp. L TaxID=944547 RepID=UPI00059F37B8|nr:hypothetical protein [Arcobacter sp. L]
MKIFILIFTLYFYSFACSGDCMSCHATLKNSINEEHHKILTSCIACHTKTPTTMVECGGDCFACHSQNKLIQSNRMEHQNLASCKKCHINKEDIFKTPGMNEGSTLADLLKNK